GAHSLPGTEEPHFTHLFVTVAGVDAHPSALAGDDSPGWQPLAAELQEHPRQVDLLAASHETNFSASLADAVLPAGFYGRVRLRFAVPSEHQEISGTNVCSEGALHCAVTSDGSILPLTFADSAVIFRIPSDSLDERHFYVPPDATITLTIALDAGRSFVRLSGDSFIFAPEFHLNVRQPAKLSEE